MDYEELNENNKTVIYKESFSGLIDTSWDLWGERKTPEERVYVYRKIVTFEEAERYEIDNELLN